MRRLSLVLFVLLLALPVAAHPILQNSMWVLLEPDRIRIAVNVSLKEILVTGGITDREDGAYDMEAVNGAAEAHREYVRGHLHLEASGNALGSRVVAVTPPPIFASAENTFYQYELEYPLAGARPRAVVIRHEMLREFPYAPGTPWEVSYVARVKHAESAETTTWLIRPGESNTLPTGWEAATTKGSPAAAAGKRPARLGLQTAAAALAVAVVGVILILNRRSRLSQ